MGQSRRLAHSSAISGQPPTADVWANAGFCRCGPEGDKSGATARGAKGLSRTRCAGSFLYFSVRSKSVGIDPHSPAPFAFAVKRSSNLARLPINFSKPCYGFGRVGFIIDNETSHAFIDDFRNRPRPIGQRPPRLLGAARISSNNQPRKTNFPPA
jgi:hypothetical protein